MIYQPNQNSIWCQINRKIVNTIQNWFYLTKFRKYLSVGILRLCSFSFTGVSGAHIAIEHILNWGTFSTVTLFQLGYILNWSSVIVFFEIHKGLRCSFLNWGTFQLFDYSLLNEKCSEIFILLTLGWWVAEGISETQLNRAFVTQRHFI